MDERPKTHGHAPSRWLLSVALALAATALLLANCESETIGKGPSMTAPAPSSAEHGVIVHFYYGSRDLTGLYALEDRLERAISAAGVGEFDGNEIAVDGSDGYLYMYGPLHLGDRVW